MALAPKSLFFSCLFILLPIIYQCQTDLQKEINLIEPAINNSPEQAHIDLRKLKPEVEKRNDLETNGRYYFIYSKIKLKLNESDSNYFYLNKALEFYSKTKNPVSTSNCNLNIGNYFFLKGEYDKALETYLSNINFSESHGLKSEAAGLYKNAGLVLLNTNKYKESEEYYQKALEIFSSLKDQKNISMIYLNFGSLFFTTGDLNKAQSYFEKALVIADSLKDWSSLTKIYGNIGSIIIEKGDTLRGLTYYKKSLALKQKFGEFTSSILNYNNIGMIYTDIGLLDSAHHYLFTGLNLAKSVNARDEIKDFYKALSDLYFNKGDYKKSREYLILQMKMQDTIFNTENLANIETIKTEFDVEKKATELKISQSEIELQKAKNSLKTFYLVGILLLFLISIVAFFIYFKIYKKQQLEVLSSKLNIQKTEHEKQLYEAEDKERRRIAQDLHDNMGAFTTSILAQIDSLTYTPEKLTHENVKDLRTDAENIMNTLRETIWVLKTKEVSVTYFTELVRSYAFKNLDKNANIVSVFNENITVSYILSPAVTVSLYRILQEIIQNIIKHSKATKVTFSFNIDPYLRIEVIDNGVGFETENQIRKSGLENMEYRAQEINFSIQIHSKPSQGTKILLSDLKIPISE